MATMHAGSMLTIALTLTLATGPACGQATATGSAQAYPDKPIRIIAAAAGGSGDFAARAVAQGLKDSAGWTVVVDNRPGGLLAMETVAKAPPDGYVLLIDSLAFVGGPLARQRIYDMTAEFTPIASVTSSPTLLVVPPSTAARSVKELIDLAKARPGKLNYGSTGAGGIAQLTGELFKSMAGVYIVHVPFKATAQALTDVMGGQVQLMFATTGPATPHIKSGRLRALAVTGAKPIALFPDLPTVAATLPGFESVSLVGIYAPPKMAAPMVTRLNQEIVRALDRADIKERFLRAGVEPAGSSPAEFTAKIISETEKWKKVIKDAGIKADR